MTLGRVQLGRAAGEVDAAGGGAGLVPADDDAAPGRHLVQTTQGALLLPGCKDYPIDGQSLWAGIEQLDRLGGIGPCRVEEELADHESRFRCVSRAGVQTQPGEGREEQAAGDEMTAGSPRCG